jgi:CDP-diacylglycerol--glycerol-3-phosphate 3-phosphatidyltransferase
MKLFNIPLNIPNILSLYRIISFPVVVYAALKGYENLFVTLLIINLVTDVLDGLIARAFNMMTPIGAKLDDISDILNYILAFIGIIIFKWDDFQPYQTSFFIFLGTFIICNLVSLIKFKRFPNLNLLSWKIGGYLQSAFFFVLFVFDFYSIFYYLVIIWGIIAFFEHIIIQLLLDTADSDTRGLIWFLRRKKKEVPKE